MNKYNCIRWAVDLTNFKPTLQNLTNAVAAIQPEERVRLMKFYFMEDFLASLVGRLLIRKFVSEVTSLDYHQIKLARDVRGKPYVDNSLENHISFNISHQGQLVVLAGVVYHESVNDCTPDFGVGCDTMKIEYSGGKELSDFFRLMSKKFSDTEWRYIEQKNHNSFDQLKAFMRHWCLKESYVKELGVGITIDLQKISFSVSPEENLKFPCEHPITTTTLQVNDKPMTNWNFEEHLFNKDYCIAIAFRNCKPNPANFELKMFEDLLYGNQPNLCPDILEYCQTALKKQSKS